MFELEKHTISNGFMESQNMARNMKIAGLEETTMLFMRSEATELLNYLCTSKSSCIIDGAPGTGKSSVVWAWGCEHARVSKQKVVWLHHKKVGYGVMVVLNENKGVSYDIVTSMDVSDLLSVANVEPGDDCIIIVDGIRDENRLRVMPDVLINTLRGETRAIYVMSLSIKFPDEEVKDLEEKYSMDSWTFEQYVEACKYEKFYDTVKGNLTETLIVDGKEEHLIRTKEQCLINKYYYAGSSARWFFGVTIKGAIHDLKEYLHTIANFDAYVINLPGHKSHVAVNHVLSSSSVIVSEFATRYLALKCSFAVVEAFLRQPAVRKNPAFKGWVLELAFLKCIRRVCESEGKECMVVRDVSGNEEKWTAAEIHEDFDPKNVPSELSAEWLIPLKWNQGGYDFLQLKTTEYHRQLLRVVQVTHAGSHDFKFQYVCEALLALQNVGNQIEDLDIIILYPEGSVCPLCSDKIGYINLTLYNDYKSGKKWNVDNIRFLSFNTRDLTRVIRSKYN